MLTLSRQLLLRNGRRTALLKPEAYTANDVEANKNLSKMHIGRLKGYDFEDPKIYDDISNRKYSLSSEKSFASQNDMVKNNNTSESLDKLYSHVDIEIMANNNKVLNSYARMMIFCCKQLNIEYERMQLKPVYSRRNILRSAKHHKKFRVMYEARSYTQIIRLNYLTGATYNAVVGYFQMNLPHGVAMKCHNFELLEAPEEVKVKKVTQDDLDGVVKFRLDEADYEPWVTTDPYFETEFD